MMTLPATLQSAVADLLREKISSHIRPLDFTPVPGGCVNHGGKLKTSDGIFFLKYNDAKKFPDMLRVESEGLRILSAANAIAIPSIIGFGNTSDLQFLLLDYIDQQTPQRNFWRTFGERLAKLHRVTNTTYGLEHNNYIGSLRQSNTPSTSWVEFFITQRIEVQLALARDQNRIDLPTLKSFDQLFSKLQKYLVVEKPSLLHGDLWSGNLMCNTDGNPCLIDPAVYFGNREVDIAMTQLFGRFDKEFLDHYTRVFPLSPDFSERLNIYNLYPLLVHVNLFGGGYLAQVKSTLKKYTS